MAALAVYIGVMMARALAALFRTGGGAAGRPEGDRYRGQDIEEANFEEIDKGESERRSE